MYTQAQINSVSLTFRTMFNLAGAPVEECIEVALEHLRFYDAVSRGMVDEYSGEVIVDCPFVCREPSMYSYRLHRYIPGKEHVYADEDNAKAAGWAECEECGCWFNPDYYPNSPDIDGRHFCCAGCAESYGFVRCEECGEWMDADAAFAFEDRGGDVHFFCDQTCAENRGWVTCDHCGDWTYHTHTVMSGFADEEWCDCCYDGDSCECNRCGGQFNEEDGGWDEYGDCWYCDECLDAVREPEWDWTPEIEFFGDGDTFMGTELETDADRDARRCDYVDDLRLIDGFTDHFWLTDDGSLANGVEITSHPMSLAYHWKLYTDGVYTEISDAAREYGYTSHDNDRCGLHISVNDTAFGKTATMQEVKEFMLTRLFQRHKAKLVTFSRRTSDRWCHYETYEDFTPKADKVDLKSDDTRNGIIAKAKRFKANEREKYRAVNICHRHHVEIRIFRGTLKWSTYFACLALVEGMVKAVKNHGSEWVEKVTWYDLMDEVIANVSVDGPREMLADYLEYKGLR